MANHTHIRPKRGGYDTRYEPSVKLDRELYMENVARETARREMRHRLRERDAAYARAFPELATGARRGKIPGFSFTKKQLRARQ